MWTISKEYSFCAAHRLEGHPKCGRLHGHNYRVTVTLKGDELEGTNGMILDYGQLDKIVKPIIDEFDHRYIVSTTNEIANDPYTTLATSLGHAVRPAGLLASTAECIARWFCEEIVIALGTFGYNPELWEYEITVKETDKSAATYSP